MAQTATIKAYPLEDADIASPTSTTKTPSSATEGTQRQTKRLTSSFPVLPPTTQVHVDYQASFSPKHSSPAESARSSPRLAPQPVSPTDPNNFLTTLAAQERRVLELREELQKAENDLASLKRQWAIFEANRKKSGIRQVEQLQPLSGSHLSKTDLGGDIPMPLNASTFEKLAAKPARKPQQRVFSGSRHTRTLSLLTPAPGDRNEVSKPFSSDVSTATPNPENENNNPTLSPSSTMPSSEASAGFGKTYKNLANRRSMPPPSADALVKTGKQMASDLRDGLWTFFEDIRQATIGEEGISGTDTRNTTTAARQKATSKSSPANGGPRPKRSSTALGIVARQTLNSASTAPQDLGRTDNTTDQSFWKEFGVDTPGKEGPPPPRRQEPKKQPPKQPQQQEGLLIDVDVDDGWDAWESPVSPQKTSPRRNTEGQGDNSNSSKGGSGALPWPELIKLTPSKLTRTVSDLMREWDSPYSEQSTSQSDTGQAGLDSSARVISMI